MRKQQFIYILIGLSLCLTNFSFGQHFTGYHSSNYAGLNAINQNPAHIADGRFSTEINILSGDLTMSNNYIGVSTSLFAFNRNRNPIFDTLTYSGNFQLFRSDHFNERNVNQARIHQYWNIQGPSVSFSIGKNTFAITSNARQYLFIDNLDPTTAEFILDELENPATWNINLDNQRFHTMGAAWTEYGLAYGREIWSNGEHFVKGGVHAKFALAAFSSYFYADELVLNFNNADTVNVNLSDIRFGYSNNLSDDLFGETFSSPNNFFNNTSFNMDFGFVYEWRPNHAEFMNGDKQIKGRNKYKLQAGFSFTDLGYLRFQRGNFGGNFDGVAFEWNLDTFASSLEGIETFAQLMQDSFQMDTNRDPYNIRMPSAFNFFADYHIWKGFYANFAGTVAFNHNNSPLKMHALNSFALTPRYEHTWFGASIPMTFNGHNNFTAGAHIRVGPLFLGSNDIWNYTFGSSVKTFNVYGGLKIGIPHKKKKKPVDEPIISIEEPTPPLLVDSTTTVVEEPKVDTTTVVEEPFELPPPPPFMEEDSIPNPEPLVDFPSTDLPPMPDTLVIHEEERAALAELLKINKTFTYSPPFINFEPFEMELSLSSVYFETGSSEIEDKEQELMLKEVAAILKSNDKIKVEIHGHADNVGDMEINIRLSNERAAAVRKYLEDLGVNPEQIIGVDAFGSNRPTADNDTEEGRRQNRRVELILTNDGAF